MSAEAVDEVVPRSWALASDDLFDVVVEEFVGIEVGAVAGKDR